MPSTNLIIYALLVFVGVRAVWQGVRGLRGEVSVRYGLLTRLLLKGQLPEAQGETDQMLLKVTSILRMVFGTVVAVMGIYSLIIELSR